MYAMRVECDGVTKLHVTLKQTMSKESMVQFYRRSANGGTRKPLRTITELAEEFGLTLRMLTARMGHSGDAPNPIPSAGNSNSNQNTWYDPDEMRRWWREYLSKHPEVAAKKKMS